MWKITVGSEGVVCWSRVLPKVKYKCETGLLLQCKQGISNGNKLN